MAGFMVGSALLTWILCSALNAGVEYLAIEGHIDRNHGFLAMVAGMCLILTGMLYFCLEIYPASAHAGMTFLLPEQAQSFARLAALADGLLVLGYAGFQLRRFWEDD